MGQLGGVLGVLGAVLGRLGEVLWASWVRLGASWKVFGASWRHLGGVWEGPRPRFRRVWGQKTISKALPKQGWNSRRLLSSKNH